MNSTKSYCNTTLTNKVVHQESKRTVILNSHAKNEHKILKLFLLERLYQLFYELYQDKMQPHQNLPSEYYVMDSKIIQFLIHSILETEEYTLEGIAYYTHIPFDVIFDAACGNSTHFSITPWARIVDLYIQVKPDVAKMLFTKLIERVDKNHSAFSTLLTKD